MMSQAYIQELSRKAAYRAAREHRIPFAPDISSGDFKPNVENFIHHIPNLGSYVPKGWAKVDDWFVDSSGFGADDEPALSLKQFLKKAEEEMIAHPETGFAITETGQFQVYVGVFRRKAAKVRTKKTA
jgi:hypothetical protein